MENTRPPLADAELMGFAATTRPGAARAFYEDTLGLRLVADERDALVFDSGGTVLRVSKVAAFTPMPFTVLGWKVEDISAAVGQLRRAGVSFRVYEGLHQDEDGVCTFPDGTRLAWFQDPDGNVLSLTQFPDDLRRVPSQHPGALP